MVWLCSLRKRKKVLPGMTNVGRKSWIQSWRDWTSIEIVRTAMELKRNEIFTVVVLDVKDYSSPDASVRLEIIKIEIRGLLFWQGRPEDVVYKLDYHTWSKGRKHMSHILRELWLGYLQDNGWIFLFPKTSAQFEGGQKNSSNIDLSWQWWKIVATL